jgi:hypothetical protein
MVEMSLFEETKHEIRSRNFFHKIFGYPTKIAIFRQARKNEIKGSEILPLVETSPGHA